MDKSKHDKPTEPCLECGEYFDDCECDYFNIGSAEKYEKQAAKMFRERAQQEPQ